jgi:hypothetical protein
MVPLRYTADWLGAETQFDPATKHIVVILGDRSAQLTLGAKAVTIRGITKDAPAAPLERDGVMYIPLRVVDWAFGASIGWDDDRKEATVSQPGGTETLVLPCRGMDAWCTALHLDAYAGLLRLADRHIADGITVDDPDVDGATAVSYAVLGGQTELLQWLLGKGASPNAEEGVQTPPLLLAYKPRPLGKAPLNPRKLDGKVRSTMVELLLDYKADPNGHGLGTSTILCDVAAGCDVALAQRLLKMGAKVNIEGQRMPPLFYAVGNTEMAKVLLDAGASTTARENGTGYTETPLIYATGLAAEPNLEVLKLLLEHGAEINARDAEGKTALHAAAGQSHVAAVRFLAAHGANLNVRSYTNYTPLSFAREWGTEEVVKVLRDLGAKE